MSSRISGVIPSIIVGILLILTKEIATIYLSTKVIHTKFGRLRGSVVTPNHRGLRDVEVYLGVPYAAPPVGPLRFMPPTTQKEWHDVKKADIMPPVCPQKLPDVTNRREALKKMPMGRYNYLQRLLPQLRRQSEDCLYLNIYAPMTDISERLLPVMIYIHGESYEWNSGNPYDGTVLSSYGRVVVVTLNFRLGILGFLRQSLSERAVSNFGLLDQNAALHWVKENIRQFGGDPDNVTVFGHGTGAALANLLLLSPITSKEGSIRRAILMSGSALSRWAVTSDPYKYTIQVAKALKCPLIYQGDELVNCLRSKTVQELLAVPIQGPPFTTPLGPIVDDIVIKRDPYRHGRIDISNLGKYDLLFGVTSAERFNILTASEERYGMSEERKNRLLRAYISNTFAHQTTVIYNAVSNEYKSWAPSMRDFPGNRPEEEIRDQALHILSDAQIVAPVVNMGDVHSEMNSKSHFYVFNHQSIYGDYPHKQGTVHGEELAYVFGAPLVGGFSHFAINYTLDEQFLSELVMTLWTNFAKTGNPNMPVPQHYITEDPTFDWEENMRRMWPAYDGRSQHYLHIDMQVLIKLHYRAKKLDVWNHFIPSLINSRMPMEPVPPYPSVTPFYLVPTISSHFPLPFTPPPAPPPPTYKPVPVGTLYPPTSATQLEATLGTSSPVYAGTPMSVVILIGVLILFLNCFAMAGIYYKRDKLRFSCRNGERDTNTSKDDVAKVKGECEESDSATGFVTQNSPRSPEKQNEAKSKSSSHLYHSSEILLDTMYNSTSESNLNEKNSDIKAPISPSTLPRESKVFKTIKDTALFMQNNGHRRNRSENSIYSELSIHGNQDETYKKNNIVKFNKIETQPLAKSTSSIASVKSSSSRASVKSTASKTSSKCGSSKPLKKNASCQSLPTSEYSWGITKEMTMNRHEPEGRDDKPTQDSHQTVESFQKKNYPKVLPNVPIIISEVSTLNRPRPFPPPRSTSLTARDLEELEDLHVIYRKKKTPKRDVSTDSCDLSNLNPFYGMGAGEAPASPTVVYGTTPPSTATVRRSGIYGQYQSFDSDGKPKVPVAPQPPVPPNIYLSRTKGPFETFGKQPPDKMETHHTVSPIMGTTSAAVVTAAAQSAFTAASAPALVGAISTIDPNCNTSDSESFGEYDIKKVPDTIIKRSPSKKQIYQDSNGEKPLKSALKQTSAYDKPKGQLASMSSSASINLSVVPSGNNSSSSSLSNNSIYASQLTGALNSDGSCQKRGAVVVAPTTRNKQQK